jgi:hypothetical protein
MIKEKYKQLTSLIPSELRLSTQFGGIRTITIHVRSRQSSLWSNYLERVEDYGISSTR